MSIYKSLLESQIAQYNENDIADAIENGDANASEQERAKEAEFEELNSKVDDILAEQYSEIIKYDTEYRHMLRHIGLLEINEADTSEYSVKPAPMPYTKFEAFLYRAMEKIKNIFYKIKEFVKNFFSTLIENIGIYKKFYDSHKEQISKGYQICIRSKATSDVRTIANANSDGPLGYTVNSAKIINDNIKIVSGCDLLYSKKIQGISEIDDLKEFIDKQDEEYESDLHELVDLLFGQTFSNVKVTYEDMVKRDANNFSKKAQDAILGNKQPYFMPDSEINNVLTNSTGYKRAANTFDESASRELKESEKAIENLKSKMSDKGYTDKEDYDLGLKICSKIIRTTEGFSRIIQKWRIEYFKAINTLVHQANRYSGIYITAEKAGVYVPKVETDKLKSLSKFDKEIINASKHQEERRREAEKEREKAREEKRKRDEEYYSSNT